MGRYQRGLNWEKQLSKLLHQRHLPVLISPLLLRQLQLGQIDLSYLKAEKLILVEAKTENSTLSGQQKLRLRRTADFLAQELPWALEIRLIRKTLPKEKEQLNL